MKGENKLNKFLMDKDGSLSRNPDFEKSKTHTIYCRTCEKEIGESETDDNGFAVCLDCYYDK